VSATIIQQASAAAEPNPQVGATEESQTQNRCRPEIQFDANAKSTYLTPAEERSDSREQITEGRQQRADGREQRSKPWPVTDGLYLDGQPVMTQHTMRGRQDKVGKKADNSRREHGYDRHESREQRAKGKRPKGEKRGGSREKGEGGGGRTWW
jgi:hypothetical protein